MALVAADEVDEAHLIVFDVHSDFMKLVDVGLELLDVAVEFGLELGLLLGLGRGQLGLEGGDFFVRLDDVLHDATNQGESAIRLSECESLSGSGKRDRSRGEELRTRHLRATFLCCVGRPILSQSRGHCDRFKSDYDLSPAAVNFIPNMHVALS